MFEKKTLSVCCLIISCGISIHGVDLKLEVSLNNPKLDCSA